MTVFTSGFFFMNKASSRLTRRSTNPRRPGALDVVDTGIYARRRMRLVVTLVSLENYVGAYIWFDIMCSLQPDSELW
jgi:hypothetical protein